MGNKKVYFDSQKTSVSSDSYLDSSRLESGYIRFGIACGYDFTTEVHFIHENILAVITAAGEVAFYDSDNQLLEKTTVAPDGDGRGCYQDVCCKAEQGKILVQFPIYSWVDHYPDCDGESDRWSARIIDYKKPIELSI